MCDIWIDMFGEMVVIPVWLYFDYLSLVCLCLSLVWFMIMRLLKPLALSLHEA